MLYIDIHRHNVVNAFDIDRYIRIKIEKKLPFSEFKNVSEL